ncbi:class I glutamine amidotransferase-like protein, partial [Peziza echinospora]
MMHSQLTTWLLLLLLTTTPLTSGAQEPILTPPSPQLQPPQLPVHTGPLPTKFAILLYPGFDLLDAALPLAILTHLTALTTGTSTTPPTLLTITQAPGFISTNTTLPLQHTLLAATPLTSPLAHDIDVLLLPGGPGTLVLDTAAYTTYITAVYPRLQYILTFSTGSGLLARTGLLDGRRAAAGKRTWRGTVAQGRRTEWAREARWVGECGGKMWTFAGTGAGLEGVFVWVGRVWGGDVARRVAEGMELEVDVDVEVGDGGTDRFSEVWRETMS